MAAGKKVAEEAIDAVADAAELVSEESAQVAVATRGMSSRNVGFFLGGVGIGVAIGFAGGYFFRKKTLQLKYEKLADGEISAMREHFNSKVVALESTAEKKPVSEVVQDLGRTPEDEGTVPYYKMGTEPDKTGPPVVTDFGDPLVQPQNIFERPASADVVDPHWDYAAENRTRDPEVPYTIHQDEFKQGREGYEQHTLTYFEGDDTLCNENDHVIEDQDATIGLGNLSRFGQGSGDPNIVYVRNEEMQLDFEIVHSDRKFAVEVHGFADDEIQHSSMKRRSPRRSDNDISN